MGKKAQRPVWAAFMVLLASVLVFVSTTAIFADSSRSVVKLSFPIESFEPDSIRMIPIEDELFLVYGAGEQESFALLLSESGTVLSQAIVPGYVSYPLYSAGRLSFVVPYESLGSSQSFGIYLYPYDLTDQTLVARKKQELPWIYAMHSNDFCTDSKGRFYASNTPMGNTLLIFDQDSSVLQMQETRNDILQGIAISPEQVLYTLYETESQIGMTQLPDQITTSKPLPAPVLNESGRPEPEFRFLDSNTVIDSFGVLYAVNPHTKTFSAIGETVGDPECAAMLGDGQVLIKTEDSRAVVYEDGEETDIYAFDGNLCALARGEALTAAIVEQDGEWYFTPVTDRWLEQPEESSESSGQSQEESGSTPEESSSESSVPESGNGEITSKVFAIDKENQRIYISEKTTYAALKKELDMAGAALRAERPNGVTLASGYVMTGAVLFAEANGVITDSLTVIVPGDLNGSGTVTESSSRILYRVLNGTAELDEASFAAADLDGDGKITTVDLLALKKKIQSVS